MQIGCDPKADSTSMLMNGRPVPTILDTLRNNNGDLSLAIWSFGALEAYYALNVVAQHQGSDALAGA